MFIEARRSAWFTPEGCHVGHSPRFVRHLSGTLHPAGVRLSRRLRPYKHGTPTGCHEPFEGFLAGRLTHAIQSLFGRP